MPKLKTKSGAKKRFKVTASGKILHKKAFLNHILTKKETKQKRRLGHKAVIDRSDENNIRSMIPYGL